MSDYNVNSPNFDEGTDHEKASEITIDQTSRSRASRAPINVIENRLAKRPNKRAQQIIMALITITLIVSTIALLVSLRHVHRFEQLEDDLETVRALIYTNTPTATATASPTVTSSWTPIRSPTTTTTPSNTPSQTLVPSNTPTPTLSPTATYELSQGACSATVLKEQAEIKEDHDAVSNTLEVLDLDRALAVYERTSDNVWYYVFTGRVFGWIEFTTIHILPDCISIIPVAQQ